MENIIKIMELSEKRINFLHNKDNAGWYEGYETYTNAIREELKEVEDEIKDKNSVYLEDELGDIFWSFICLTNSLQEDGLINKENIFKRCLKKYKGRLGDSPEFEAVNWEETKKNQKKELLKEHYKKYGN